MLPEKFPTATSSVDQWLDWSKDKLAQYDGESTHDPLADGVRSLAFLLSLGLEDGAANASILHSISKKLCDEALFDRSDRFGDMHLSTIDNIKKSIFATLDNASLTSMSALKKATEETFAGVVFTAHPTFAVSRKMRDALAILAMSKTDNVKSETRQQISALAHQPDDPLTLYDEHRDTQDAIANAQSAMRFLNETIAEWAEQKFAGETSDFAPNPLSLATWVGYDLDGRTDIHWGETFRLRLSEKEIQLKKYAAQIKALNETKNDAGLAQVVDRLNAAADFTAEQVQLFSEDLNNPDIVVRAANLLTEEDPRRLTSLKQTIDQIKPIATATGDRAISRGLQSLVSEMENFGLGVARIHLRVNATQVRSTLRADLGITGKDHFSTRTLLSTAAERSANVTARQVNMASVFAEKMTARRQFMVCAQFKKHIDAQTPIRFLIAECEAPATVMGAVFLARLYGVDDIVDISPLFETADAIERGGRFMERLLDEPEYIDYIRKRGRIAIQLGFSDSGRFIGQLASDLAIERLHILLARALAAKDINDIEVVIFNTHGESMGRGAFPGGFKDRFDHLLTPWTRSLYNRHDLKMNAECSFQGGDGFLHFQSPEIAKSTIAQFFEWVMEKPGPAIVDRFYEDINFSWDFYRGVKSWQETLFDNVDYHITLSTFGSNFLVKSGSRRVRRQSKDPSTTASPRSMRAIPNNAILQQLCAPMNVCGGVGSAAGTEPERFQKWAQGSMRVNGLIRYASKARMLTDLGVLRSYANLYNSSFWNATSSMVPADARAPHSIIANRLSEQKYFTALSRLANHFDHDLRQFDDFAEDTDDKTNRHCATSLRLLHAIRIALIMQAFKLTASVPSFSGRHDISYGALIDLALKLDFEGLINLLTEIFPMADESPMTFQKIAEVADDLNSQGQGYPEVHHSIIKPLRVIHEIIAEIGVGISHHYNAYG